MKRFAFLAILIVVVIVLSSGLGQQANQSQSPKVGASIPTSSGVAPQNFPNLVSLSSVPESGIGHSSAPLNTQGFLQSSNPVSTSSIDQATPPMNGAPLHITKSTSASSSTFQTSNSRHLGFWIDERDIWGGGGLDWTAQQFVQNYFLTAPYPSAMYFSFGTESPYASVRDPWISQVCQLASAYPNIKIIFHAFANMHSSSDIRELNQFFSGVQGCAAAYGADLDYEYYNNGITEDQQYKQLVNSYGLIYLSKPGESSSFPSDPILGYSTYPYYGGELLTGLQSSHYVAIGYGEIGGWTTDLWTQAVVTSIVEKSAPTLFTLIYSDRATYSSYTGTNSLWHNPTLRSWIWDDPYVKANYALSTSITQPPPGGPPPPTTGSGMVVQISPSVLAVGKWFHLKISGASASLAIKLIIFNQNTHKIAAILYPGHTSSSGSFSCSIHVTSNMIGSDGLSVYLIPGSSAVAFLTFNVS